MSRVLLAGGGTGGHVFPALATADALRRAAPDLDVEFVGTERGLESRLCPQAGWSLHHVEAAPLARTVSPATLRLPLVLLRATAAVARIIRERDVVAAAVFGGYVSVPLALAARRMRIPLVVHEQNAVPGVANKLAARWADAVAVTYPGGVAAFGRRRVTVTGNPVRPALAGVDRAALRAEALAAFGLDPGRRTLLVFGGSQGARRINEAAIAAASLWREPGAVQVLHATGAREHDAIAAAWDERLGGLGGQGPLVRCEAFIDRMDLAYAAADAAVCRAGASTIAELTVLGVPSVLVPYPHATADHQSANARALEDAGGAVTIADGALTAETLVEAAEPLLADDGRRATMAARARAFGRPDAADALAALLVTALRARGDRGDADQGPDGGANGGAGEGNA